MLHDNDIFVIARITVFQDPFYAKLRPDLAVKKAERGNKLERQQGLSFIDVAATEYWDHIIDLSVDSYNIGFDELNFDYVRYPSDGPMNDISFPHSMASKYGSDKQANLEAFFKYLNEELDDETRFDAYRHENTGRASSTPYTSADLFGMTTTNWDDLSIGQVQERTVPYFDFTAPMVYPSHYPNNYLGLGNPNDHPYQNCEPCHAVWGESSVGFDHTHGRVHTRTYRDIYPCGVCKSGAGTRQATDMDSGF